MRLNCNSDQKTDQSDDRQDNSDSGSRLNSLKWMTGTWSANAFGGQAEETWMVPRMGSMLGMYRFSRNGEVIFYELMCIEISQDDQLILRVKHFNRGLTGWEDKDASLEFPELNISESRADFAGLVYEKLSADHLKVTLAVRQKDGAVRQVDMDYFRDH